MIKIRTLIIVILIYLVAFLSIKMNLNIFYPYYLIKDLLLYPVVAMEKNPNIKLSEDFMRTKIDNLEEEINELKKLNIINFVLTDYNYLNATVIERNREYWFNSITINKGSNDDIKLDMAVIDGNGLIGRISKVGEYTSDIKLITTNDINSKISVVIKSIDNIYGITKGFDYDNNLLKVIVDNDNNIEKGLTVETTGMGGVFPKGILIGKVENITKDSDNVGYIVLVKLSSNIKDLRYVSVLSRKEIFVN